ncbi:MAG: hypothetical protein J6J17_04405 [Bacilli bacterium]|nr:hypothetical protein [Bacilli bacterium]
MENKKRSKATKSGNKRKVLILIFILLIAILLILFAMKIGKNNDQNGRRKNVVDEIKSFDYSVSDTDTKLFKDTFKELKKELSKSNVDKKNYASLISKLFIIDFYTLSNKSNVNDVGAVQFVYSSYKTDFVDIARTGIYKQVQSNLDNNRTQKLPEVESVTIESIEEVIPSSILEHKDFRNVTEANAYEIKVNWTYKESNDFQDSATILVVPDKDKLSVAKLD